MRTGLMMEFDSEQGIEYLRVLLNGSVSVAAIVFVGHQGSPKADRLLQERTGGLYMKPSLSKVLSGTKIPAYFVDDVNSPECLNTLAGLGLDLLVAQSSRIIRLPIFDVPKYGILNCHTAILPYMRGCSCLEWSIYNDQPMGATCHFMVRKVDAGPIVSQSLLKYRAGDTYETIRTKMIYLMATIMGDSVAKIASGKAARSPEESALKGPWFSPMRDPEAVQVVKDKLLGSTYNPTPFPNHRSLEITDVDISAHAWSDDAVGSS
jgi:methionyl-tRNA formyltransferase